MTPFKEALLAELMLLREVTVADLTIRVNDARWREVVARCRDIRKQLRQKKLLKFAPKPSGFTPPVFPNFSSGGRMRNPEKYIGE